MAVDGVGVEGSDAGDVVEVGVGRDVGFDDSRCASCAVSCVMSGVDKVLVWARWERAKWGICGGVLGETLFCCWLL